LESANNSYHSLIHPIKLPGVVIAGNIFLAPMAGYTDASFRSICLHEGAYFAFTEMISSEACYRQHQKTFTLLEKATNEAIYGVQIFARDAGVAALSIKEIARYQPAIIDLNCGCSIPKILKAGAGAILLKEPAKIADMIKAMKDASDIPVSIKIRSGWDQDSVNFLEVAGKAVEAGASLVTLHPRTRAQLFKGHSDWEQLKQLKASLPGIPVIGSGDLFTASDVLQMLSESGCDGVMIARGALGNPFIFRQVKALLNEGHTGLPVPDTEILATAMKHLELAIRLKGERRGCIEMRKLFCAYTRGLAHSAVIRQQIVFASDYETYKQLVGGYLKERQNDAMPGETTLRDKRSI